MPVTVVQMREYLLAQGKRGSDEIALAKHFTCSRKEVRTHMPRLAQEGKWTVVKVRVAEEFDGPDERDGLIWRMSIRPENWQE